MENTPPSEQAKKFARKPCEKSEPSSTKKSMNSSLKEMYIKASTPSIGIGKEKSQSQDFLATLLSSFVAKN
jgi:hypothetical protein